MTETDDKTPPAEPGKTPPAARPPSGVLRRLRRAWAKAYGPVDRASARFLDAVAAQDRRRRVTALAVALWINVIVLTLMSTFARVRIWIPNAPSDTINVTLVELPRLELPDLRDPEIAPEPEQEESEPEPEPAPEIVEQPEPEPEPEPNPIPEPALEQPPEQEAEIIAKPAEEPEPEIKLDLEPVFAPPAEEPEPLIPDPALAAEDDLSLPPPEEEAVEQSPAEDVPEPLVSVEPEREQQAGLDDLPGSEDANGEDEAEEDEEDEDEDASEEELLAEEKPQGDDMFDEEPALSGRRFVRPQVQLPIGEQPVTPGSSGVIAIFCPEQFEDKDKAAECAGRREIRSGWRPGDSGEDWTRAAALLKRERQTGLTGPDLDKVVGPASARRIQDQRRIEDLRDFRRNVDGADAIAEGADDNLMRGVEGDRPDIGPSTPQPSWTLRDDGELTEEEIEKLKKELEDAEKKK